MTERPDPDPGAGTGGPEPGGPESEGPGVESAAPMTITRRRQLAYAGWTMTLLAYILVLNAWVEINDSVVIDPYAISITTAVVLLLIVSQKAMVAVWRALGDHHGAADIEIISE